MSERRTHGMCGALRRWLSEHRGSDARNDSGQALWLAIILVLLLGVLGPLIVSDVTSDTNLLIASGNKHAALAAAEAGIQWYRDNLDSYSAYYTYTASNNPLNDPALAGWCGAGQASTCGLAGTNPAEAFHYVPDATQLFAQSGGAAGTVVLTVTGRAGGPGHYNYIVTQTSFSAASVLNDAYFSNYEVLDDNSDTIQGTDVNVTTGGTTTAQPETSQALAVKYTYTSSAGSTTVTDDNVWQALCLYETYQPNTFIDTVGLTIGNTTYSATHPYYGPYQSQNSFTFDMNGNTLTPGGSTQVTVQPSAGQGQAPLACGTPYDFVNGESFSGPVYTNDQLHICGSPTFNGSPVSLTSGAPSDVAYAYDVPGSIQVTTANDAPNGPYPDSLLGDYVPAGYTEDQVNCSNGPITPNLAHGVELNGTQGIPQLNLNLPQYGTTTPPSGTTGTGCTYTGPTMIELVTSSSGTTTMNVWSPLSSSPTTTSACSGGGTFSASNPFITGIALPSDGVIYVQSYTLSGAAPTVPSDGSTPCFNPYRYNDSTSDPQCYEGDVYIEGELHGQLTVASAANILITRDLTDYCVDQSNGGAAINTDPSSVSGCTSSTTPDMIGLDAQDDVLISGNNPNATPSSDSLCTYDGTGTPTNTGTKIPPSTGTSYPNDPAGVWPWLCNAGTGNADPAGDNGVIVDAAVLANQGSFGDENWDTTCQDQRGCGNVYLEGTDLSDYRGPFGITGTSGYYKVFSYDQRLDYVTPPYVLPNGIPVWQVGNYIVCSNSATLGALGGPSSCPAP